jgi:hypothetical protein
MTRWTRSRSSIYRLAEPARRRAMAVALALLGAAVVVQTWHRPDLPAYYGQSAFADLGPATLLAALAVVVALAALARLRAQPA